VIRVETLWLSVVPLVMRAGMDTLLAQVEQVFGKARPHHAYLVANRRGRIVPMLADEGVCLASESTFDRLLRETGQTTHPGRAKAPGASRPPSPHIATVPRQVWCWDMTICGPRWADAGSIYIGSWVSKAARSSAGKWMTPTPPPPM
jgi:hypothetical protein